MVQPFFLSVNFAFRMNGLRARCVSEPHGPEIIVQDSHIRGHDRMSFHFIQRMIRTLLAACPDPLEYSHETVLHLFVFNIIGVALQRPDRPLRPTALSIRNTTAASLIARRLVQSRSSYR